MPGDRSVSAGRDITGSSIVTGDHSTATTTYTSKHTLPPPESVDIRAELASIRATLAGLQLQGSDASKVRNALQEAEEEAASPTPRKDEVGKALERAVDYASKANGFAEQAAKLAPHLKAAASWCGQNWHKLLAIAGIAV
jgi:hypothetical protein